MKIRTIIPLALFVYAAAMYCVGGWVAAVVLLCLFISLLALASFCYWAAAWLMDWIGRSAAPGESADGDRP